MNKYSKFLPFILVLFFLSAGLIYCGGGGGGGGGGSTATEAFNFTEDNMEIAAGVAAADSGLYSNLSSVVLQMMSGLSGGGMSTAAVIDVGDIGLCALGTGTVSWNDADDSLDLSVGDTATLTLTACQFESTDPDTIDGTLTLTFTAVTLPASFTADLDLDVTIVEFFDSTSQTEEITASFSIQAATSDGIDYTITITAVDADDIIVDKIDGQTRYSFGCFTAILRINNILNPSTFTLTETGVISVPGRGIMSAGTQVNQDLSFLPGPVDPYADSGIMIILSTGTCAALGVPDGVDDSDGSFIRLLAIGGGNVQLELFDSGNNLLAVKNTTWDNLD